MIKSAVVTPLLLLIAGLAHAAEECVRPAYGTFRSEFENSENFGNVAFSFSETPGRLQVAATGQCFVLPRDRLDTFIYFFVNHYSNSETSDASYLAVQIVKKFKSLWFDEQGQTWGLRRGNWERNGAGMPEIYPIRPFNGISGETFLSLHASMPINEDLLRSVPNSTYWHGSPKDSVFDSRDFPAYFSQDVPFSKFVQLANLLLRFESVPRGGRAIEDPRGVPFSTKLNSDIEWMRIYTNSPSSVGFTHAFTFRVE